MRADITLAPGEGFVPGRSPVKARELLAAAEAAGLEPGVVRTTSKGYIVPEELLGAKKKPARRGRRVKPETPEVPEGEAEAEPEGGPEDEDGADEGEVV